jgi:hypothetical protein
MKFGERPAGRAQHAGHVSDASRREGDLHYLSLALVLPLLEFTDNGLNIGAVLRHRRRQHRARPPSACWLRRPWRDRPNPEAQPVIQTNMILGVAFAEAIAIYALVVAVMIGFVF